MVIKTTMTTKGKRWAFFKVALENLVSNKPIRIQFPFHRKEITKLKFRALALRQRDCGLCVFM